MEIEAETRQKDSLDNAELSHFERLASEWWNESGKFRSLHAFNPVRLRFIVEEIARSRPLQGKGFHPLEGLSMLDVGCGGGLLAEPLARLGASVTGIDPVCNSVKVAAAHAARSGLSIIYRFMTAEDLASEHAVFDIVIASEVIEHVADIPFFIATCRSLCRPGGLFFVSTLNRTAKSFAFAIVAAEHIFGLIPRGTHDWRKFVKSSELNNMLIAAGFKPVNQSGIVFNPLAGSWALSRADLSVNYIVAAEAV